MRAALDAYYTPDALAVRLVSLLPIGPGAAEVVPGWSWK